MPPRKTQEQFIAEAKEKHGENKYDYSKVVYVNGRTKIPIICKNKDHGEFWQNPEDHLQGHGCPKCGGREKYTTESFIKKAKEIHRDNKYDYSKVVYIDNKTKVLIICPIINHGDFWQRPDSHLQGKGCIKCSGTKQHTKESFILIAKEIHKDNKYDYSKVVYINNKTKVCIICPIDKHGNFWQRPDCHLNGQGCFKCYGTEQLTNEEFIEKANEIHDNRYDYSKVKYVNSYTKVCIACPIDNHGDFWQIPYNHTQGSDCPKCTKNTYSQMAIEWLEYVEQKEEIKIQHAENIGEYQMPNTKYKVDGYCEETNTVYEFHGDYWHGNPELYEAEDETYFGEHFGELFRKTMERENEIRELGYNLVVMWENDWLKFLKDE